MVSVYSVEKAAPASTIYHQQLDGILDGMLYCSRMLVAVLSSLLWTSLFMITTTTRAFFHRPVVPKSHHCSIDRFRPPMTASAISGTRSDNDPENHHHHDLTTRQHYFVTDETVMAAMEQLEALDKKLGTGSGATKERAKLNHTIKQWEEQEQQVQSNDANYNEEKEEEQQQAEDEDNTASSSSDDHHHVKFVFKHSPTDRVAVFGGDPNKRRHLVEKRLQPYKSLDQFGSPRDVGSSGTISILQKIESRSYDVVYIWTRYGCHASRNSIRKACLATGTTRFEEVQSLAYIITVDQ